MKNKVYLLLALLAIEINLLSQSTNDTIYIYEDVEVYDTVFVYDTVWERREVQNITALNPITARVLNPYEFNSTGNYFEIRKNKNNIIINENYFNDTTMKKLGFFALTLAAISGFGQEIGFKFGYDYLSTSIIDDTKYNLEMPHTYSWNHSIIFTTKPYKRFSLSTGLGFVNEKTGFYTTSESFWSTEKITNKKRTYIKNEYFVVPIALKYRLFSTFDIEGGVYNNLLLVSHKNAPWTSTSTYDPSWFAGVSFTLFKYLELGSNYGNYFKSFAKGPSPVESSTSQVKFKHQNSYQFYATINYPLNKDERNRKINYPDFLKNKDFSVQIGTGIGWQSKISIANLTEDDRTIVIDGVTYIEKEIPQYDQAISSSVNIGGIIQSQLVNSSFSVNTGILYKRYVLYKKNNYAINDISIPILISHQNGRFSPYAGLILTESINYIYSKRYSNGGINLGIEYQLDDNLSIDLNYLKNLYSYDSGFILSNNLDILQNFISLSISYTINKKSDNKTSVTQTKNGPQL